jgi:hypothetical protein
LLPVVGEGRVVAKLKWALARAKKRNSTPSRSKLKDSLPTPPRKWRYAGSRDERYKATQHLPVLSSRTPSPHTPASSASSRAASKSLVTPPPSVLERLDHRRSAARVGRVHGDRGGEQQVGKSANWGAPAGASRAEWR